MQGDAGEGVSSTDRRAARPAGTQPAGTPHPAAAHLPCLCDMRLFFSLAARIRNHTLRYSSLLSSTALLALKHARAVSRAAPHPSSKSSMSSGLLASLPQPRQAQPAAVAAPAPVTTLAVQREAPPYLRRAGFVPRKPEDFGDGGAFPEIHVAQYPLGMGKDGAARGGKTLAISVGADGDVNYDSILRQGSNRDKTIYSDHRALVPKVDLLDPKVRRVWVRLCGGLGWQQRGRSIACSKWCALRCSSDELCLHACASSRCVMYDLLEQQPGGVAASRCSRRHVLAAVSRPPARCVRSRQQTLKSAELLLSCTRGPSPFTPT